MVQRARQNLPHAGAIEYATLHCRTLQLIFDSVLQVKDQHPDRQSAVLIPELVESRWYHYFLHNHRAQGLKVLLLFKGGQRVMVINVPWYLSDAEDKG